jgi:hypothetical protein
MADEAPDQFGISLAFVNESETIEGKDYIRPQSIASADLVSSPAATNGLFEEVVKFIEDDEVYVDILQMILNSFRKLKRKPHGFFTEGLIQQFNMLVEDIANYINAKKKDLVEESLGVPSFVWFKKVGTRFNPTLNEEEEYDELEDIIEGSSLEDTIPLNESEDNLDLKKDEDKKEEKKDNTSEFFSFKDFKKVVSTHKEKRKIKILNENSSKVNIVIGKFQPFNNGHLKMCTRLKKENNLPVFLCVVHPGSEPGSKYPFSDDLIKKSIGALTSENNKLFAGYEVIPSNLLEDAINSVVKHANPASVCIGERDFENMVLQREWVRNKYDLEGGDIEIYKTPQWSNNNDIRSSIKDGDFQQFKSKVPKSIAVLFNEFSKQINGSEDDI